jgi:sulfatase maturation enzyme AslB (radical SAM superfamily)
MITPEQIDFIEFNVTNLCNARCPACPRTMMLDQLDLTSMSPELFETIAQGLGSHAKTITASFCGTTGDAVSHPNIDQIIELSLQYYKDVFIETNGGIRSTAWWSELGRKHRVAVRFSIDGLKDTNALYRINTDFDKIIANAQAFIDAGGRAQWKYLIFDHNCHQVELAEAMAKQMGFKKFSTVATNRFSQNNIQVESNMYAPKINKVNEQVKQDGFVIAPAKNSDSARLEQQTKTWQTLDQNQDVNIDCRTTKENYLFIDQWGKLWPCCFWATEEETHVQHSSLGKNRWKDWRSLFHKMYDSEFNQLSKNNSVVDMLNHPLFVSWLPDSFAGKHNKCTVCLSHCTANKTLVNQANTVKL